jgi:hypothetical protein
MLILFVQENLGMYEKEKKTKHSSDKKKNKQTKEFRIFKWKALLQTK